MTSEERREVVVGGSLVRVFLRGDPPPAADESMALLDNLGRLWTRPGFHNAEGLWCHHTTGRVPWRSLPFPLVGVPIPDYRAAVRAAQPHRHTTHSPAG